MNLRLSTIRIGILAVCGLWGAAAAGCALEPYQYGRGWHEPPTATPAPSDTDSAPQICEGRPNKLVDGVGWVLGIPGKVLLWDRRVNNHAVSADTTTEVSDYLEQNQLPDVCVRVNQYAPGEEWRRLRENQNVGAGWRYTLGTLSLVGYTLIPGRLVGRDRYNPYTNSLYVYSDIPSLAIQSAAYAKDVHLRNRPGTYAAVNELPVVSLWHDTVNTNDALGYVRASASCDEQAEAQRILYPYYGARVGGSVGSIWGPDLLLVAGGAVIGHVTGRLQTQRVPTPDETVATSAQADRRTSTAIVEAPVLESTMPIARGQQADGPIVPE
jgi:hypothetical protein